MGLDMYLKANRFIWTKETKKVKIFGIKLPNLPVSNISFDLGYWRKANAIHKWFVNNVQEGKDNCEEYNVSKEKFEELLGLVQDVLKNRIDAPALLPTQDGFFFGGLEYDEDYFRDLEDTEKICKKALKLLSNEKLQLDITYRSSW